MLEDNSALVGAILTGGIAFVLLFAPTPAYMLIVGLMFASGFCAGVHAANLPGGRG